MANCPAHEDRKPSLSIHLQDGKTLLHCHAGCTVESICAASGVELRDLFANGTRARREVEKYTYTDEKGNPIFQVVRYEPKGFMQRRPDGRGGWVWGLNGTRRVPYRLAEVLRAEFVLIVEGERDVESARALGFTATCNPGGAGKWSEEFSQFLHGKSVAVIADADEPGRQHALQVASSVYGKARSLKMFELPGPSKDLSEWKASGGTENALKEFIRESVPEWRPDAAAKAVTVKIRHFRDVPDIFALPDTPVVWIVSDFLAEGAITIISGEPGCGKSSFALALSVATAIGTDFIGRRCSARDVLYLDRENPLAVVKRRLALLGVKSCPQLKIWGRWCEEPPPGIGDTRLREIARESKPLIIIDSFIRFHISEENSATEMARVWEEVRKLTDLGSSVLVLHHKGKDETKKYRGSSEMAGGPDVTYTASRDKGANLLRLSCFKTRYVEVPEIALRLGDTSTLEFLPTEAPQGSQDKADAEKLRRVIEAEPGLLKGKVIERSRIPEKRATRVLEQGVGKLWREEKRERNARQFFPLKSETTEEL